LGLEHFEKLHKMVAQDPARLSEQIDVSLGSARLRFACSLLKQTSYFLNFWAKFALLA